jgi:hypothetical protein
MEIFRKVVTFIDMQGEHHDALVVETWTLDCVNLVYVKEDGSVYCQTSVPRYIEGMSAFYFITR